MSFANSKLFRMLKSAGPSRIGDRIGKLIEDSKLKGAISFYDDVTTDIGNGLAWGAGKIRQYTPDVRNMRLTDAFSDAGTRLGSVLGDMMGKVNADTNDYGEGDIIKILNEKEEIALMNREADRLRRLARIQHRKREKIRDMTTKALRSPYI